MSYCDDGFPGSASDSGQWDEARTEAERIGRVVAKRDVANIRRGRPAMTDLEVEIERLIVQVETLLPGERILESVEREHVVALLAEAPGLAAKDIVAELFAAEAA